MKKAAYLKMSPVHRAFYANCVLTGLIGAKAPAYRAQMRRLLARIKTWEAIQRK